MNSYFSKYITLWFILVLIFFVNFVSIIKPVSPALAQGENCPRPDLPPAPTPIVSVQPMLSEIDTVLTNEANQRNWPEWILKTIAKQESNWRQVDQSQNSPSHCEAKGGDSACTCVSSSGDYGIMQLNWKVHNSSMDWDRIQGEYEYNINQGANVLASGATIGIKVNDGDLSSTGNPINQYLNLWRYNGYSHWNNPYNTDLYDLDRNWNGSNKIDCSELGEVRPYQERVLYTAKCEANVNSEIFWSSIDDFPLPDDALFASDLDQGQGPTRDILIFDVQTSNVCLTQGATFQYTLITTQPVTTQIVIHDQKPWAQQVNRVKTLPIGVNEWDGTNETGQPVPEAEYWFTVTVTNTNSQLIGLQSGLVQVGCQQIYLPVILKNYLLLQDTYEPNDSFDDAYLITTGKIYTSYIWSADDVDWFKFDVSVPVGKERLVEVWLESIPSGTDYDLAIYDSGGNKLDASAKWGNSDEYISRVATTNEPYYLEVYPFGGTYSHVDSYELRVEIGAPAIPKKFSPQIRR